MRSNLDNRLLVGVLLLVLMTGGGIWRLAIIARPVPLPRIQGDAARGRYLAETFGCIDCHTPRLPDGITLDTTRLLTGGRPYPGPWGLVHSANVRRIAPRLTDAELAHAIRGQLGFLYSMPTAAFNQVAEHDLRDLITYLRTLSPIAGGGIDPDTLRAAFLPPPANRPQPVPVTAPTGVTLARGKYLVGTGGCSDCHTPRLHDGSIDESRQLVGSDVPVISGSYFAPNLTPDVETGIGRWNTSDIVNVLHCGRAPDGHQLNPFMPYASLNHFYTPDDALAVARYLKSLPAVRHPLPPNPEWRHTWQPGPWLEVAASCVSPQAPVATHDTGGGHRQ